MHGLNNLVFMNHDYIFYFDSSSSYPIFYKFAIPLTFSPKKGDYSLYLFLLIIYSFL